jgi:hypothetical protein
VSELSNLLKCYRLVGEQEGGCFSSPQLPRRHSGYCHLFVRFRLILTL